MVVAVSPVFDRQKTFVCVGEYMINTAANETTVAEDNRFACVGTIFSNCL